jgi:hypothetical protein
VITRKSKNESFSRSQDETMKPVRTERRAFFGTLIAGLAGGIGFSALMKEAVETARPSPVEEKPLVVAINPNAVPRKKAASHEA